MNHFRLFAIQTMLMFALISTAQQTASTPAATDKQQPGQPVAQSTDPVDQHLRLLSEKLGLSVDQQVQIRPILQQMLDARQKLVQDNSLSNEAREERERLARKGLETSPQVPER